METTFTVILNFHRSTGKAQDVCNGNVNFIEPPFLGNNHSNYFLLSVCAGWIVLLLCQWECIL